MKKIILLALLATATLLSVNSHAQETSSTKKDAYYSCAVDYGVGGKGYQEFETKEECEDLCRGACVKVEHGKEALDDYQDVAWVSAG